MPINIPLTFDSEKHERFWKKFRKSFERLFLILEKIAIFPFK
jgi:hypothetical protein